MNTIPPQYYTVDGDPIGIPFTQYLLPDGRKKSVHIMRPDDIVTKARAIIDAGYSFEIELLRDRKTVSLTIASPDEDEGDVDIEVVENGPGFVGAVDRMVVRFAARLEKAA